MSEKSRNSGDGGNREGGRGNNEGKKRSSRGFASMDPEQQRKIARKGGEAVSEDRKHMSEIGKKGGEASAGGRGTRITNN